MSLSAPVAMFIFNRPDLTEILIKNLSQVKPKKLLVIADGPRFPEEQAKCEKTRAMLSCVNWDCEVLTNFADKNLGCRERLVSGTNWVFEQVEEAILLEDDCQPDPSFYYYCEEMLSTYRYVPKIMHVAGWNFVPNQKQRESYRFSRVITPSGGFATWRRAWNLYDPEMRKWPDYRISDDLLYYRSMSTHLVKVFDAHYFEWVPDSWDGVWLFTCISRQGLSIIPKTNLLRNVGFGSEATHTGTEMPHFNVPVEPLTFPLVKPATYVTDRKQDVRYMKATYRHGLPHLIRQIKRKIAQKTFL